MNWSVETKTQQGVSTAVVTGRLDASGYFQMRDQVRREQLAQGGTCVLLDLRKAIGELETLDVFAIASSNPDVFPRGTPYALVIGPRTCPPEDARFAENVAINRGALVKIFTEESAAREWLAACLAAPVE